MIDTLAAVATLVQGVGLAVPDDGSGRSVTAPIDRQAVIGVRRLQSDGPAFDLAGQAVGIGVGLTYTGDIHIAEDNAVYDAHALIEAICAPNAVGTLTIAPPEAVGVLDGMAAVGGVLVVVQARTAAGDVFDDATLANRVRLFVHAFAEQVTDESNSPDLLRLDEPDPPIDIDALHRAVRIPFVAHLDVHAGQNWAALRAAGEAAVVETGMRWLGLNGQVGVPVEEAGDEACDIHLTELYGVPVETDDDGLRVLLPFTIFRGST